MTTTTMVWIKRTYETEREARLARAMFADLGATFLSVARGGDGRWYVMAEMPTDA